MATPKKQNLSQSGRSQPNHFASIRICFTFRFTCDFNIVVRILVKEVSTTSVCIMDDFYFKVRVKSVQHCYNFMPFWRSKSGSRANSALRSRLQLEAGQHSYFLVLPRIFLFRSASSTIFRFLLSVNFVILLLFQLCNCCLIIGCVFHFVEPLYTATDKPLLLYAPGL